MKARSLGTLLMDFFLYYGTNFPYDDSYISVTEGRLLPKESADWVNYYGKPHKLVIQCLVDPGEFTDTAGSCPRVIFLFNTHSPSTENDIAKAAEKIQQVTAAFRGAHEALLKCTSATARTNMLGSANIVQLKQKVLLPQFYSRHARLAHFF